MKENKKILFKIRLNYIKFQHLTAFFLGTVILHKLKTIAFTDMHSFELVWPRNMNNKKARDTLLLNNTITQNPILAREPGFGMLYHICCVLFPSIF